MPKKNVKKTTRELALTPRKDLTPSERGKIQATQSLQNIRAESTPTTPQEVAAQEQKQQNFQDLLKKTGVFQAKQKKEELIRGQQIEQRKASGVLLPEEQQTAIQGLEQAGAFEEVNPQIVDLTPSERMGQNIPLLGASLGGLQSVLGNAASKGWLPPFKAGEAQRTGEGAFPIPQTPETLREASLREIRQKSYDEGISAAKSFGSAVEAIPVVGSLARKYAAGLSQTPSASADNILKNVEEIGSRASSGQSDVNGGFRDPITSLNNAREMEENIAVLEGKMKTLIDVSPILRASPEEINNIQTKILDTKEKISAYRQASVFALTAELTGTSKSPTNEQLYFKLKEMNT